MSDDYLAYSLYGVMQQMATCIMLKGSVLYDGQRTVTLETL